MLLLLIIPAYLPAQNDIPVTKGTAIISIISNDTIWIGADSRLQNTRNGSVSDTAYKIIKSENMVFAHSGLFNTSDGSLNINRLFKESAAAGKSFTGTVLLFDDLLISQLLAFNWKSLLPGRLMTGDTLTDLNITTLFAKSDSTETLIVIQKYHPILRNDEKLDIRYQCDTIRNVDNNYINIGAMGNVQEIMSFLDRTGVAMLEATNPEKFITFLIKDIAAKNHPAKVGGPVDIIRLTKDDIKWLKVKQNIDKL